MKKQITCIVLVLVLVCALFAGCGSSSEPAAAAPAATTAPAAGSAADAAAKVDVDMTSQLEVEETYEWPEMTLIINDYNVANSGPASATQLACDHIEEVSGGKIKCDVYFGGTLMESTDSFAGTAEGMADITYYLYTLNSGVSTLHNLFTGYYTREMPDCNGMFECVNNTLDAVPAFREEFAAQNLYELVGVPTTQTPFEFNNADLCMSIKTPDDLKGHLVQSSGYNTPAWANHDVSGMSMPPSEWYTNLERGVVDCLTMNLPGCRDFGLTDITNAYLTFGNCRGMYNSCAGYFANLDAWNSWDPEVQELIKEAFWLAGQYTCKIDSERMWDVWDSEMAAGKLDNHIEEADMQPWYDLGKEALELWKADAAALGADPDALYEGYMEQVDLWFAAQ